MIKAGIVGGTGYTGVELLRLLVTHPAVELAVITSRGEKGVQVSQLFPNLRGRVDLAFVEPDDTVLKSCDVVFFATPNGTAMKSAAALLEAGGKIIGLAADFRLRRAEESGNTGTGCRTPARNCWRKRFMVYPKSTARPFAPPAWSPIPVATQPPCNWGSCRCSKLASLICNH